MKRKVAASFLCALLVVTALTGVVKLTEMHEPVVLETVAGGVERKEKFPELDVKAKSAVLIDAKSGKVLYEQDSHKQLPPAYVTKIMTMLLAVETVEDKQVKLTDKVTISENAASMGGSQMYLEPGEVHTLEELMEGIAVVSANDGAVAVAEHISGSEMIFVEKMNKRARELGMVDTHFVNPNGLPVADHYTSAYDIAVMSKELIKHKKTHDWLSIWQKTIKVGLPGKEKDFCLTNTNKLLKTYQGANGIKTGFTVEAMYCLSASAMRNNTTLIAVAMGSETSKIRNAEVARMLDYGFATYYSKKIVSKGEVLGKTQVIKAETLDVNGVSGEDIYVFIQKGKEKEVVKRIVFNENIKVPIKRNQKIGLVNVYVGKEQVGSYNILAEKDIEKVSLLNYYIRKIKNCKKG